MKSPCVKDCPERLYNCHISCKRYREYREYLDEINALKRKENEASAYMRIKAARYSTYYAKKDIGIT